MQTFLFIGRRIGREISTMPGMSSQTNLACSNPISERFKNAKNKQIKSVLPPKLSFHCKPKTIAYTDFFIAHRSNQILDGNWWPLFRHEMMDKTSSLADCRGLSKNANPAVGIWLVRRRFCVQNAWEFDGQEVGWLLPVQQGNSRCARGWRGIVHEGTVGKCQTMEETDSHTDN